MLPNKVFFVACNSSSFTVLNSERSHWGANMVNCSPFPSCHGCVPEVSWCAHHLVYLRHFNLTEPIHLQCFMQYKGLKKKPKTKK